MASITTTGYRNKPATWYGTSVQTSSATATCLPNQKHLRRQAGYHPPASHSGKLLLPLPLFFSL
ncbi:MAG: hypothetical protein U0T82_02845 [Bacteroidales bacterium]